MKLFRGVAMSAERWIQVHETEDEWIRRAGAYYQQTTNNLDLRNRMQGN